MSRIQIPRIATRPVLASLAAVALLLVVAVQAVRGQDDILSFVPPGGRTLLTDLLKAGASPDIVTQKQDASDWMEWIEANRASVPGLKTFDEYQTRTLADYLAYATPLDTAGLSGDALTEKLPRDGRDMALRYCQSCHIITVSITQDRTREAWLGTLGNPSHVEIAMDEKERGQLADYYVVNGGIPIEQVPPALRAGGASY